MSYYPILPLGSRFNATLNTMISNPGLPFDQALPEKKVQQIADDEGIHFPDGPDHIYTPTITLWAFVMQVLSGQKSCVAAVARVLVLRLALDLSPCSANTGGYCKARAKLSESFLQRLT